MLRVLVKSSLGPRHYLEKFQIPRASLVVKAWSSGSRAKGFRVWGHCKERASRLLSRAS